MKGTNINHSFYGLGIVCDVRNVSERGEGTLLYVYFIDNNERIWIDYDKRETEGFKFIILPTQDDTEQPQQTMTNVLDFVEKYYPNYSGSDTIAYWDDLQCIIDGEFNENRKNILLNDFNEDIEAVHVELDRRTAMIYAEAIEGYFLETLKQS